MSDNKVYQVTITTEVSATYTIVAPNKEEAETIALDNEPYAGAFDPYEFGEEWNVSSCEETDANPADERKIDQKYKLGKDND
ncbi:hypothetical protein SEA_GIBBLES_74 [Gordonia phage Gibbles]|uniref:Uncharacterized protein n=3 Tax=Gordonia phage Orchid TaxID=1838075 RepID=A0A160DHH0_9CAUD|nr:hypothetical protein BH761_gp076 [Gordonia phage Orchid]ANA87311.1 hypothetical protein PBI_PATRICKSTAR_77 [Gordonia phage PatrickStar]ANA87423.1 hypothetical protein PBI_ORCHID_76 [Gordonia phage Orchid]ANA87538.1 hypothetical protein PBI_KAMPE_77 [Gordonia phage Kampe]QDK02033.1 hypothetical protein SEA_GIBBLES_74 [Gordonia phage Gibbles]